MHEGGAHPGRPVLNSCVVFGSYFFRLWLVYTPESFSNLSVAICFISILWKGYMNITFLEESNKLLANDYQLIFVVRIYRLGFF